MTATKAWKSLITASLVGVLFFLAYNGASGQTSTNIARVVFKLEGLNVRTPSSAPLTATVDPAKTGLGKPPAIVTVSGGRPAYTVTCSNPTGYDIAKRSANTFAVTRTKNGVGTVTVTITDTANNSTQVKVTSVMTGLNIRR
ncbi:MAG: hypothetical protein FJ395_08985 [Verrucomicrobia bacterium]|nr:hypothetical protein [Verrucomicrobiota bacterium]